MEKNFVWRLLIAAILLMVIGQILPKEIVFEEIPRLRWDYLLGLFLFVTIILILPQAERRNCKDKGYQEYLEDKKLYPKETLVVKVIVAAFVFFFIILLSGLLNKV